MIYVMSDIHGHYDEFTKMLKIVNFKDEDELYVLGDCIDKGPKSIETLLYCLEHNNIHMCLGNHEFMMYQYIKSIKQDNLSEKRYYQTQWFNYNFGRKTYDQYMKLPVYKRNKIFQKLRDMQLCFPDVKVGDKTYYLVHSCPLKTDEETIPCVNNCSDSEVEGSVWGRDIKLVKNKIVIHGHTICRDEKIHINDDEINIDCGAAADWTLSCLRLNDMKEYYIRLSETKYN